MGIVDKISAKIHGTDDNETNQPTTHKATHDPSKIHEGTVIDPNPSIGAASHAGHKNAAVGTTPVGSTSVDTNTAGVSHGNQTSHHITHPNAGTTGIGGTHGGIGSTEYGHGVTGATHDSHHPTHASATAGTHGISATSGQPTHRHETVSGEPFSSTGHHGDSHQFSSGHTSGNIDHSVSNVKSSGVDSREKTKVNESGEPIIEKNAVTQEVRHEKNKGNTMMANIAQSADEFDRKVGRVFNQETMSGADKGIGTKMLHKKEEKHAEKEMENKHDTKHTTATDSGTYSETHPIGTTTHHGGSYDTTSGTAFGYKEGEVVTGAHPTTVNDLSTSHQSGRTGFANVIPQSDFVGGNYDQSVGANAHLGNTHAHPGSAGSQVKGSNTYTGTKDQSMDTSVPVKPAPSDSFDHNTNTDHHDAFNHESTQSAGLSHGQSLGHNDSALHGSNYGTHSGLQTHDDSLNTPRTAGGAAFSTGNAALDEKVARLDVRGQQKAQDAYNKGYQDGIQHH